MTEFLPDFKSVEIIELDRLLKSKDIALREDHKKFLIEYGGCDEILRNGFANFTFEEFKNYYLDESVFYSDRLPSSTVYFGMDFNDELLCIDNESGRIYVYYNEKKDGVYYESINDLLFFCFMRYKYKNLFFKKVELNVKIDNPNIFLMEKKILSLKA